MLMVGILVNLRLNRYCSLRSCWFFLIGGIFCLGYGLVILVFYVLVFVVSKEDKENV